MGFDADRLRAENPDASGATNTIGTAPQRRETTNRDEAVSGELSLPALSPGDMSHYLEEFSFFSMASAVIIPGTTDPSAKINVGVPLILYFCPV